MNPLAIKLTPDHRRKVIINAALNVVERHGLGHVTFKSVSENAAIQTSPSTVKHYFPTRDELWNATIDADTTGRAHQEALHMGFVDD